MPGFQRQFARRHLHLGAGTSGILTVPYEEIHNLTSHLIGHVVVCTAALPAAKLLHLNSLRFWRVCECDPGAGTPSPSPIYVVGVKDKVEKRGSQFSHMT